MYEADAEILLSLAAIEIDWRVEAVVEVTISESSFFSIL